MGKRNFLQNETKANLRRRISKAAKGLLLEKRNFHKQYNIFSLRFDMQNCKENLKDIQIMEIKNSVKFPCQYCELC